MNIAFHNAIGEYFRYSKMKLKKSNYEEQRRKIFKYIVPFFKDRNIYELNLVDIVSWKMYIESFDFSYNYKSYLYYALVSIFDFFEKYYEIKKNYVKLEGNFKNNDLKKKGNIWTIDEFNKFISCIDDNFYKVLFELLYFTGLRKGEVLALKWEDIDFINKTISINKTITRNHEFQTPKTKSSNRTISISDNLINELSKLNHDHELIFDISFTQLKRKKDYYCNLAGVKQIKIHEFRHSHACLLFTNNIEIEDISYRLGHSNISMTMSTYLKYLPRNEKRVVNLLNFL